MQTKVRQQRSDVLLSIPAYLSVLYPVDTKCTVTNKLCHIDKASMEVFSNLLTYANGELGSRLLYNAINRKYVILRFSKPEFF